MSAPGGNPWAGEVALCIDGQLRRLRLTLGALAELEAELGAEGLLALIQRFEGGAARSRDVLALIVAGLRGGGWQGAPAELLTAEIAGGPLAAARAAAQLLARAFVLPEEAGPGAAEPRAAGAATRHAPDQAHSGTGGAGGADGAA